MLKSIVAVRHNSGSRWEPAAILGLILRGEFERTHVRRHRNEVIERAARERIIRLALRVGLANFFSMPGDVTQWLSAIDSGDLKAAEDLLPLVYDELRKLAASRMANEREGHTLQPTALVHEAWLKLGGEAQPDWENRAHFFGAAAEAMRRILVDRARRRIAAKRGGGAEHVELDAIELPAPTADDDGILRVNEVLEKFAGIDPRKAELVKLRYFVGMSFDEAAAALGIAVPTAKQWWAYARAWLSVELKGDGTLI